MNAADREPTASEILARAGEEGSWRVPVEMALACPTASVIQQLVVRRIQRGDLPRPTATAFYRGRRLFVVVDFAGDGRPGLLFPLDVWALL